VLGSVVWEKVIGVLGGHSAFGCMVKQTN